MQKTAVSSFYRRIPAIRGFSLMEILASLAVFSVVMAVAGGLFYSMYRSWSKQRDYLKCMQDSYWALESMAKEFRLATAINLQTSGPSFPRVRLQTPYIDSGDYIWYWRGDQDIDHEDDKYGYEGNIYRALTDTGTFDPWLFGQMAYNYRRVLTRFVADNPGSAFFFAQNGDVITLTVSLLPHPENPEGPGNRNYRVVTAIRPRNQ